ncbi:MAG: hypothetical protein ABS61_03430 [Microbacterium sp. SCN 70-18]|nr:MAG: hypothetical protein ABS61_03430 [Microbacterium sp. SCN 70-18]
MESVIPAELDFACHANVFMASMDIPDVAVALDMIATAGFRRLVLPPLNPSEVDTDSMRGVLADAGLAPITLVGQSFDADVSSSDRSTRARGLRSLQAGVDLTVALGGDQMNGVPYGLLGHAASAASRATLETAARLVGEAADYAASRGVTMTFEVLNRYETNIVNTAVQAIELVELSQSDNLYIHLDTFHMAVEEEDMRAAVQVALPKLRYLELGQSGRGIFGAGAVDVVGVVRDALDDGYTGRWGIEAFSRTAIPAEVADMLAVWRSTYTHGLDVVSSVLPQVRQGWTTSTAGRRMRRLSRTSPITVS